MLLRIVRCSANSTNFAYYIFLSFLTSITLNSILRYFIFLIFIYFFPYRTEVEEVTIDSSASWKPVSSKPEIKQEEPEPPTCISAAPPPKRLKSVDSSIASPMSVATNPSTPGPPTPAAPCTPGSVSGAPRTPQNTSISSTDSTFAAPSPMDIQSNTSQPQLIRQQSLPPITSPSNRSDTNCHLSPPGAFSIFLHRLNIRWSYLLIMCLNSTIQ